MIYVYGTDPFANSPSSMVLLKELTKAGFKVSEIKYANTVDDIPDNCWVISFGSPQFRELTGTDESLRDHQGTLWSMDSRDDVFVFPTYSPGYLYHNPNEKEAWKRQLELFYAVIKIDEGVVV